MNIRRRSIENKIFNILLVLYLYYYSYRYVLRYNSSTTSPTYRDTPQIWKASKYLILISLIFILFAKKRKIKYKPENQILLFCLLFLMIHGLVFGLITINTWSWKFYIALIPIIFYLTERSDMNLEHVIKIFDVFFVYAAVNEIIQIALYFFLGRLPALAYATGVITDVRFGGSWDDPNGFAVLLSFYFPYFLMHLQGKKRFLVLSLCLVILILTWSGTGWVAFGVSMFSMVFITRRYSKFHRSYVYYLKIFLLLGALIYILFFTEINRELYLLLLKKQGSIQGHAASWSWDKFDLPAIIGMTPLKTVGEEAGIVRLLLFGGAQSVIAFVAITIISINKLIYKAAIAKSDDFKGLYYGMIAHQIAFLVSLFNLPLLYNFSNIGLFSCFIVIACSAPEYRENIF